MYKLVYYGDPSLRSTCKIVEFFSEDLFLMLDAMRKIMFEKDGLGISAPQVNSLRRVIIVRNGRDCIEMINPEISFYSKEKTRKNEGCLSIPNVFKEVSRSNVISIFYLDRKKESHSLENISGNLARVIQHEVDHLDGKLFVDYIDGTERKRLKETLKYIKSLIKD